MKLGVNMNMILPYSGKDCKVSIVILKVQQDYIKEAGPLVAFVCM